jgi:hypothetical protein
VPRIDGITNKYAAKIKYDYEENIIDSSNGSCSDAGNGTKDEVFRQRNQ